MVSPTPRGAGEIAEEGLQAALATGVDRDDGAHAGAQTLGVLVRREAEAQRHALDDLDPVAAGVLRRQDRELRAGARRDRANRPMPIAARKRVDGDRRRQSLVHVGQVGFLGIGVDPKPLVGDDGEHRLSRRSDAAELDLRHLRGDRPPARALT